MSFDFGNVRCVVYEKMGRWLAIGYRDEIPFFLGKFRKKADAFESRRGLHRPSSRDPLLIRLFPSENDR